MKKLSIIAFLICILIMGIVVSANAQNVKKDAQGNYIAISKKDSSEAKATGATYTDSKGTQYPVYISKNGKLFVNRISKNGNAYRFYLKPVTS